MTSNNTSIKPYTNENREVNKSNGHQLPSCT